MEREPAVPSVVLRAYDAAKMLQKKGESGLTNGRGFVMVGLYTSLRCRYDNKIIASHDRQAGFVGCSIDSNVR